MSFVDSKKIFERDYEDLHDRRHFITALLYEDNIANTKNDGLQFV